MKFLEWLSKLGILRWGTTAAVYHNAVERPYELMDEGVFNADRDLVGGRDPREAKCDACRTSAEHKSNP
jgi:hypothetical protein